MKDEQILAYEFYFSELEKIVNHLNLTYGENNNLYQKSMSYEKNFPKVLKLWESLLH